MKWQVQIANGKTQHCTLPPQLSEGVPFTAELESGKESAAELESIEMSEDKSKLESEHYKKPPRTQRVVRRGRHLLLLRDLGENLCLEEVLTVLAQELSPLQHGRCAVQVLYATRAGKVHSCRAEVGLEAVALPTQLADNMQPDEVISPLTGKVIKVLVAQAAKVQRGDALLIIEAMKMENVVHAECSGVVAALNVKVGAAVRSGDVLLSLRGES